MPERGARSRARAHRRAAQGHGQAPAPDSRRASYGGAQHPSRRQRRHQEDTERQENYRGRREARARRNPKTHRRRNQEDGRDEQSQRKRSFGVQVEPVASYQLPVARKTGAGVLATGYWQLATDFMKRVVHAACPHDCPDACGVLITIEDGRATRIQGDPEHPVTRGFLCAKVAKYLDRVYSPDRVLYPTRRVGPKGAASLREGRAASPVAPPGESAFERISWDEALDEITHRLRRIVAEYGCESILPYSYGG